MALHFLEQRGIIQLARKQIVILDRQGLKKVTNGTYHEPEDGSRTLYANVPFFTLTYWYGLGINLFGSLYGRIQISKPSRAINDRGIP